MTIRIFLIIIDLTGGRKGVKGMKTILLLCAAILFAIGWLKWKISTYAILYYMATHGYTEPSAKELHRCTEAVLRHWLRLGRKG